MSTGKTLADVKPSQGGQGDALTRFRCSGYDASDEASEENTGGPIMVADPEGEWVRAADALAARQTVGEPVCFIAQCELDSLRDRRHANHWLPTVWSRPTGQAGVPLYAGPPAQETAKAVDLEQFRPFVEAQRNEYISHGLTSENACVAECDELLALIDSNSNS